MVNLWTIAEAEGTCGERRSAQSLGADGKKPSGWDLTSAESDVSHSSMRHFKVNRFYLLERYQVGVVVRERYGLGSAGFTRARPLYFQDELRLRSYLTHDSVRSRNKTQMLDKIGHCGGYCLF